jgi:hypothetical protein
MTIDDAHIQALLAQGLSLECPRIVSTDVDGFMGNIMSSWRCQASRLSG